MKMKLELGSFGLIHGAHWSTSRGGDYLRERWNTVAIAAGAERLLGHLGTWAQLSGLAALENYGRQPRLQRALHSVIPRRSAAAAHSSRVFQLPCFPLKHKHGSVDARG